MRYICPNCFKIADIGDEKCQKCGYDFKNIANDDYSKKLITALNHPDYNVQYMAAKIIGELKIEEAKSALIDYLKKDRKNRDPYIEQAAIASLGEIGDKDVYDYIKENIDNFSVLSKNVALLALEKIKPKL
ncbi:HEAT repeat domain-containing protein [Thermoanaerobacterium thermosaccharolyticum]|uniref:HEAT repeat domain-containing protein n=1 Tax=Thermoanaerobacterium thermosaccharolyticum TaxID=1517 RepID=UPI00177E6CB6|nr:HEAT repeat domain-containing protein [Thermoanaerobacterium thermosaccharolyticum]MBE0068820.1 HEAT repeat domain-containing protein [Thermoanaerobacterium thermosaccharolyticum]MBE0228698.1 HEAT repeat domain-containing protein [Thermoanaerobacterium thermosaccharolyticum]